MLKTDETYRSGLGNPEIHTKMWTISGMFRCKDENYCLPHSQVCDGQVQCRKHREDEKYCNIIGMRNITNIVEFTTSIGESACSK